MGRTLTEDRKILKDWAIILAGLGTEHFAIGKYLSIPKGTVDCWLWHEKIIKQDSRIVKQNGILIDNSGIVIDNFRDGLPPNPKPQLFVGRAENLKFLEKESVDIIITSPPYNLGQEKWPMGGNGRTPKKRETSASSTSGLLATPRKRLPRKKE